MKKRNGFVSNSSSTSYCLFGTSITYDMVEEYNKNHNVDFYKTIEEYKLKTANCQDWDEEKIIIGIHPNNIRGGETGNEFKERVASVIHTIFDDKSIKCSLHEDSWYDG